MFIEVRVDKLYVYMYVNEYSHMNIHYCKREAEELQNFSLKKFILLCKYKLF